MIIDCCLIHHYHHTIISITIIPFFIITSSSSSLLFSSSFLGVNKVTVVNRSKERVVELQKEFPGTINGFNGTQSHTIVGFYFILPAYINHIN